MNTDLEYLNPYRKLDDFERDESYRPLKALEDMCDFSDRKIKVPKSILEQQTRSLMNSSFENPNKEKDFYQNMVKVQLEQISNQNSVRNSMIFEALRI